MHPVRECGLGGFAREGLKTQAAMHPVRECGLGVGLLGITILLYA